MEAKSKFQLRKEKMATIRSTLSLIPIINQKTLQLKQKLQKNRTRRGSTAFIDKQFTISKDIDLQSQESQKFQSLFKDRYIVGEKIGQGAHGVVRKCYQRDDEQIVYAVKTITLDREHILYLKKNFSEIKSLKHQNIIAYKALYFQMKSQTCYLVMEYLPFPDLIHIQIKSEELLRSISYQIVESIVYIHRNRICHRDIKPQNILYDQQNQMIKLIDFGISKNIVDRGRRREMLTLTGTPYYRAPQMFQGGGYDQKVDLWALGVTIYKLMTGFTPFESEYHSQTITNIIKGQFVFPQICLKYSKMARDFVMRLLKKRDQRLTAEQASNHLWFIDIQKNDEIIRSQTYNHQKDYLFQNASMGLGNQITRIKNKDQMNSKDIFKLKEFHSYDQLKNIQEEESMIYGCQQIANPKMINKQTSLKVKPS